MDSITFIIVAFYGAIIARAAFPRAISRAVKHIADTSETKKITDRASGAQGIVAYSSHTAYLSRLISSAVAVTISNVVTITICLMISFTIFGEKQVGIAIAVAASGFCIFMFIRIVQHYFEIKSHVKNGRFRITEKIDGSFEVGGPSK
jgi:hypothetical protein